MHSIGLLIKVLWSPGEAMFLLSKTPRVFVPILFLSVSSLVAAVAAQTQVQFGELYMNMIVRAPQAAQMPEEAKAQIQRLMSSPVIQGVFVGSAVVVPLLMVLLVTVIYFAVFTILGREGSFKAFLSITAFAFVPTVFSQLASVLRAFTVSSDFLMLDEFGSLSPATLLDRDSASPVLFAAANAIDLVSIWILILLVIGYGFVVRKSLSKASRATAVIAIFVLYQAIKLGYVGLTM